MNRLSIEIIDFIFLFVNGTNYYYVNKLFYNVVKNRIKKTIIQICLDYLNNNNLYCPLLGNLFGKNNLEYDINKFINNSYDFVDISKKNHREIYNCIFNNLPDNFYITGGSILGILKWNTLDNNKFKLSEIDVYFIGENKNSDICVCNMINKIKNIDDRFKIIKTKYTNSLYHLTFRKIQFILHVYGSLNELFAFFDFDIVCLAYNKDKLLCSFETKKMLNHQVITMEIDYINNFMEQLRCRKYCGKGFNIVMRKQLLYYDIYMCHDLYNKNKTQIDDNRYYMNDNKFCIMGGHKILNETIQIIKTTKETLINSLDELYKMHLDREKIKYNIYKKNISNEQLNKTVRSELNKHNINVNDFKLNIYRNIFKMIRGKISLNQKNYSIERISYVYDKIEEELEKDIIDKSDHIQSYNSFVYFDDIQYNDLPNNELHVDDIKMENIFDVIHLNMRYLIYICEKCGKYYYMNNCLEHIY